jgi:hypothetical protein
MTRKVIGRRVDSIRILILGHFIRPKVGSKVVIHIHRRRSVVSARGKKRQY